MLTIKILGAGCAKCRRLSDKVKDLVNLHHINAEVVKVDDLNQMMQYGIMMTPGLVINEHLKNYGSIPRDEQILMWIKEEMI